MASSPIQPLTPEQTATAEHQALHERYIMRVLIGLDMLGNTLVGGKPDETMSSDAARLALKHEFVGSVVSKLLDVLQKNHGAQAIAGDDARAEAVLDMEQGSGILNGATVTVTPR